MAPEMLLEEEYDKSADVFSFGMVQIHLSLSSLFAFRFDTYVPSNDVALARHG
jgi:serine/threonine protein kinase